MFPTRTSFSKLIQLFISIFLSIVCIFPLKAQDLQPKQPYYQHLADLMSVNKNEFTSLLLNKKSASLAYKENVSKAQHYAINANELSHILAARPKFFTQPIEIDNKTITLGLEEVEVFVPDHYFATSSGEQTLLDLSQIATYRGNIVGDQNSWVTLTIANGKAIYMIANNKGNYEIHPQKDGDYMGYYSKDLVKQRTYNDNTPEDSYKPVRLNMEAGSRTGNCIQVYIETDFSVFQSLGSSTNVATWIIGQMNNVTAVYAISDVTMKAASPTFIWSTADPYQSITNIGLVRDAFVNRIGSSYAGRLAHLLSMRNLGGGIANGIGGYCATYPTFPGPQCVSSQLSANIDPVPTYSFNTYVICHELGHVMGMRHTHACVWNNSLTQIDDCGNVHAANNGETPEGLSCFNPGSPILPVAGGTIMSNCNLLPATGINLSTGFGPIVGSVLRQNFIYALCNTGDCAGEPPTNDHCADAIILPLNRDCVQYNFGINNATISNPAVGAIQCGTPHPNLNDVWFKVKPISTSLTIETFQAVGGPTDVVLQAYQGTSCSISMTRPGCHDDKTASDKHAKLVLTLTSLDTVKIRLISKVGFTGTFNICAYDATLPCHPDIASLLDLYNSTTGANWINKTGWQQGAGGTNCNVCSWFGVTCNSNNRVISISLPNNNLVGTSLPTSLVNLTFLNTFKINGNMITSPLPTTTITGLAFLNTLDLGANKFSGTIPSSYGSMATLKNLYLDNNLLTGSLPAALTNNALNLIYVQNNNLSGCYPSTYSEYCTKSYNFTGNTQLANGVSFSDFCTLGNGIDGDGDTFCKGGQDCNDADPAIKPGATELCDLLDNNCNGLIDDITTPQTNSWVGGSGAWNVASNWSLNAIPARCADVVISGTSGAIITIPAAYQAVARSINVQAGRTLTIDATGSLKIDYGLNVLNSGTIINNGTMDIYNILNNTLYGLHNAGLFTNGTNANLNIYSSGTRSLFNVAGGNINNYGFIVIDGNAFNQSSTGIYNEGTFNNYKEITIRNLTGKEMIVRPSSGFTNHANSILRVRKI